MHRNIRSRVLALALFANAALLMGTPERASALSLSNGDLVVFFVKNGFELIINAGPTPTGATGVALDPALVAPSQFGGSLDGAVWGALAVRSPDLFYTTPGLEDFKQANLILTTNGDPDTVLYGQIGEAQAQVQPADNGDGWLKKLIAVPAANGTDIIQNSPGRLVINSSLSASYVTNLGQNGSNFVANTLPISVAGVILAPGGNPIGNSLPLFELFQDISLATGSLGTIVRPLGAVTFVPEPGTVLLLGGGLVGLAGFGRRRAS